MLLLPPAVVAATFPSRDGVKMIQKFEGLALRAEKDLDGSTVIGYGHQIPANTIIEITQHQATLYLIGDLEIASRFLVKEFGDTLTQNEFDACASFIMNTGWPAFKRSGVYRALKTGHRIGIRTSFGKYVYCQGVRLRGLELRRAKEAEVFLRGN